MFRDYVKRDFSYGGNHSWSAGDRGLHLSYSKRRSDVVMVNRIEVSFDRPEMLVPGQVVRVPYRAEGTLSHFAPEQDRNSWIGRVSASVWATSDGSSWSQVVGDPTLYVSLNERQVNRQLEFTLAANSPYKVVLVRLICGTPIVGGIGTGVIYERDP
jgi:hypothetical protein